MKRKKRMFNLFMEARFFLVVFISSFLLVTSTAFAVHELDDIDAIKKEIKGYDVKLKAVHTQRQEMIKKQDILTSEIKSLKEALKKCSGIIKEV